MKCSVRIILQIPKIQAYTWFIVIILLKYQQLMSLNWLNYLQWMVKDSKSVIENSNF